MDQHTRTQAAERMLTRVSWLLLVRGSSTAAVAALVIIARDVPALVAVLTAFAFLDGLLTFALGRAPATAPGRVSHPLWPLLLSSATSLLTAFGAAAAPDALDSMAILQGGLVVRGMCDVVAAVALRETGYNERLLGTAGAAVVAAGAGAGLCEASGLVWRLVVAAHLLVAGSATSALARRVRTAPEAVLLHGRFNTLRPITTVVRRAQREAKPPAAAR